MQTETEQMLKSLTQWWEDAGVQTLPPLIAAPEQERTAIPVQNTKPPARQNVGQPEPDRLAEAKRLASKVQTLDELITAIRDFDAGALSDGAGQAVIARGNPDAQVMLIGEAPGRDEDRIGQPFVGRSGQFLDKMFASINMDESDLYITNGVFWRPKGNRTPDGDETAMCLPFTHRHIALIAPKILITVGGSSSKTLLATETGITKLRGQWHEYTVKNQDGSDSETSIPVLPIYHPAFVLRKPATKRECWNDLLAIGEMLAGI